METGQALPEAQAGPRTVQGKATGDNRAPKTGGQRVHRPLFRGREPFRTYPERAVRVADKAGPYPIAGRKGKVPERGGTDGPKG